MVSSTNGISHTATVSNGQRAQNVGIKAMEIYFPKKCVDQAELEQHDKVGQGKYTVGLGQHRMAFVSDREDINSICLTVVKNLLDKYHVPLESIGRLEVGTETIVDKSKSVKSVLMQLFAEKGVYDIEGVDTTNACYGGTNALFNAINWVESSAWDGRMALVVAADIAVYAEGNARPTGGCGAVAMLVGADAPLVADQGIRGVHMEHAWDFYKPDLNSEFPEVDGKLSVTCYLRALDNCYQRYSTKLSKKLQKPKHTVQDFDYFCFHSPYTKLVQKSFARLALQDLLTGNAYAADLVKDKAQLERISAMQLADTYFDKDVEKHMVDASKKLFEDKVVPGLLCAKELGNMYCGSLYGGLASLVSEKSDEQLMGKRVVLFSYGSGLASTMFSFHVAGSLEAMRKVLSVRTRLLERTVATPVEFEENMKLREHTHNKRAYTPVGDVNKDSMWPGDRKSVV